MSTLSTNYTNSPLGLLNIENLGYTQSFNSLFSSWEDGDNKQKINVNDNTNRVGTNNLGKTPHTNDIYDISNTKIIKKLKKIKHLKLESGDFAYLRDLGVYPNNRLVIVRRYPNPVIDDLYSLSDDDGPGKPLSTIIGWTESFSDLKITVSETWGEAEVSFTSILNEIGKDFRMDKFMKDGLGTYLERGANVVTLPGASLLLQRKIMKALGIIGDEDAATIPAGSPNLIKESKVRKTLPDDRGGSGLTGKFTISLKTTYEQKFINGQDPTPVFMDILNNALNMGTSPSVFYLGLDKDAGNKLKKWMTQFSKDPLGKITEFLKSMLEGFKEQLGKLKVAVGGSGSGGGGGGGFRTFASSLLSSFFGSSGEKSSGDEEKKEPLFDVLKKAIDSVFGYVADFIRDKYKVGFMGVITSLTGAPSTPWHVTVGNPLKPIFCSGDMLCSGVDIEFGDQLSFNDLPSYITVTVKLTSARNLGLQEIFAKFNNGQIRTTNGVYLSGKPKSFWNSNMDNYSSRMTNSGANGGSSGSSGSSGGGSSSGGSSGGGSSSGGNGNEQKEKVVKSYEYDKYKTTAAEIDLLLRGATGTKNKEKVKEIFTNPNFIKNQEDFDALVEAFGNRSSGVESGDLNQWLLDDFISVSDINKSLNARGIKGFGRFRTVTNFF